MFLQSAQPICVRMQMMVEVQGLKERVKSIVKNFSMFDNAMKSSISQGSAYLSW